MNKKIILITFVLILILTAGCGRKKAIAVKEEPAIPVKVVTASQSDLRETFSTTGTVEATEKASVSSKAAGRVSNVYVELGSYVKKGQVLMALEKTDIFNQLNQAKASLAQSEAGLVQSRDNFKRIQKLFAESIISQQEYDSARTQYEISEAQVNQTKISVAMCQEQLRNAEIHSPISGYIGSRKVNQGEMVSPGVPLLEVVDLSRVYVTVNFSDSYIAQTKTGQKTQITLASYPEKSYLGSVYQIAPISDPITKTFQVRILLNNSSRIFKDGMLAEVKMNFNERTNTLNVPIESIIDETGTKAVFVVENKKAVRKMVTLGISDGKKVEILSGLAKKDRVVVLGQNKLEDGSKVVVK